jgi:hypothetical protein
VRFRTPCHLPTSTTPQQPSLCRLHWLPYARRHPARRELPPSHAISSLTARPSLDVRMQAWCGGAVFTGALMSGCKADGAQFDDTATGISGNSTLHFITFFYIFLHFITFYYILHCIAFILLFMI